MKYECTVIFDASSSVTVEADTPEEAAELAQDMTDGNQYLCHQCAHQLETGDSLGVHVYNEECTEQLLDTTYKPPQRQWVGLTSEDIYACDESSGLPQYEITTADLQAFAYAIEAKLREKNSL